MERLASKQFTGLPLVLTIGLILVVVTVAFLIVQLVRGALQTSNPSRNGSVITVRAGENLQSAINSALPGDKIVVDAGAVFRGNFALPNKSGSAYITIQSSRVSELPEGVRVGPEQGALFARLEGATVGQPVIRTTAGSHHYRLIGLEISTATPEMRVYDLVRIGESKQAASEVPHNIVIDRSWIHGFPTQEVQRGISLNGGEISITNSYISEIHGRGYDTQAVCGWNGPGPFRIINNYLEASGENILFGGADPSIANLIPSNIEIRGNHLFKPLRWKVNDPAYGGIRWTVKNLLELKMARNVIIDDNILENSWGDAQIGYAVLFTVRNQDGKAPWAVIENVSFTNNVVKNTEQGFQLLGKDSPNVSQRATGVQIKNNLFIDIGNRFFTISGFPNVTLDHNTHFQGGNIMILHGEPSPQFVYTNNITARARSGYGIFGDGVGEGNPALSRYAPGAVVENNILIGANASIYPKKNHFPASVDGVGFVAPSRGDYRLSDKSSYKRAASDGTSPGYRAPGKSR